MSTSITAATAIASSLAHRDLRLTVLIGAAVAAAALVVIAFERWSGRVAGAERQPGQMIAFGHRPVDDLADVLEIDQLPTVRAQWQATHVLEGRQATLQIHAAALSVADEASDHGRDVAGRNHGDAFVHRHAEGLQPRRVEIDADLALAPAVDLRDRHLLDGVQALGHALGKAAQRVVVVSMRGQGHCHDGHVVGVELLDQGLLDRGWQQGAAFRHFLPALSEDFGQAHLLAAAGKVQLRPVLPRRVEGQPRQQPRPRRVLRRSRG